MVSNVWSLKFSKIYTHSVLCAVQSVKAVYRTSNSVLMTLSNSRPFAISFQKELSHGKSTIVC